MKTTIRDTIKKCKKNLHGHLFEKKTKINKKLPKSIKMCEKREFNKLMFLDYGIPKMNLYREPDIAFIDTKKNSIKILEKKFQTVEGSADTKLWAGVAIRDIYKKNLWGFDEVDYAFCLSNYFKKKFDKEKKYQDLYNYLNDNNVKIFFGDDKEYQNKILKWIKK
jgi:hypothetical protein